MAGLWPRLLGRLPKVRTWQLLLREVLREMQFSTRNGHPSALTRQQQQRAQRRARRKPQQTAGETGAQALLFGLGSGSRRGQTAMLSCGHPLVTSSSQAPGKGSAGDPLSGGSSVFSLLQGKALPQGSGLAGFTSWQLTMDSGP